MLVYIKLAKFIVSIRIFVSITFLQVFRKFHCASINMNSLI